MRENNFTGHLKVVIVDDSPVIAERVQALLSDLGNVAFMGVARNTASALLLMNDHQPHVVILDIHLEDDAPWINGMDLITTIRKTYPQVTIMMLTNLAGPQYRIKALALGADYFFDKSNDFHKIPETLKEFRQSKN